LQARAAARLNLRIPPSLAPETARAALIEHLRAAAPWGVQVTVTPESAGSPFLAATDGPAYEAMRLAMREAYGESMTMLGQGGSIPLCNVFSSTVPGAEIILMGVEEPQSLMHAPNESVHPNEIADMALAEALFLRHFTGNGNTKMGATK
jgi:acetylornithine deacetylase/succinyl-diaminopimelate desuccinylase-like protein